MDWQEYSALGIVVLTAVIMSVSWWRRRRRKGACGKDCSCGMRRDS